MGAFMNRHTIISRRQLVIGGGALGLAAPLAAQNVLDVLKMSTRADQLGPYYPLTRPLDQDGDLTRLAAAPANVVVTPPGSDPVQTAEAAKPPAQP